MRYQTHLGLFLALTCTIAALNISSAAGSTFTATGMGKLTAKATATTVWTTPAGKVECTALHLTAGEAVLNSLTQEVVVAYTGCKAFGLAATVSTAKYVLNADGTMSLQNTITVTATGCTVTIPSVKNQNLPQIIINNSGNNVLIVVNVNNGTSSGTGAACTYPEESTDTLVGRIVIGIIGFIFHWN